MRILIAGQIYGRAANGQAVFTTQLASGLASEGNQVTVVVPSFYTGSSTSMDAGVTVHRLRSVPVGRQLEDAHFTVFPWLELRRIFDRSRPQVVHLQDHYPLSRWVHAMANRWSLPEIGTNHFLPDNIIHYVWPYRQGARIVARFLWWTMSSLFRRLDLVTTPTATAAEILKGHLTPGPPIRAISCGVDVSRYTPSNGMGRGTTRRKFRLPEGKPLFLYVGRIDQEKDLDVLIRALAISTEDVHLAIIGTGRWESQLRDLTERLDLQRQVTFMGFVSEHDLPGLLHSADVFAMPSPAELQSIATLEAMAAGKPILAADARALPELVDDGTNGTLFAPGDPRELASAMQRLLNQRDRWSRMGWASRAKVTHHSIAHAVQEYCRAYRQLIGKRVPVSQRLSRAERARLEP